MKRTRRLLSILLVTMLLAALLPSAARAAFDDEPCKECGNTDWKLLDEVYPTCTEPGERLWRCEYCYRHETEIVPALGHSYEKATFTYYDRDGKPHTPVAATCTDPGLDVYFCTLCSDVVEQTVPALGHALDDGTVITPPTCTKDGVADFNCLRCGGTFTIPIPAPGHTWDEGTTTAPEGLHDGSMVRTCLICGETETTVLRVDAADLFADLRNLTKQPTNISPLVITRQPEGGTIPEGGMTLTVKAKGGTEPYRYEWYSASLNGNDSPLAGTLLGAGADLNGSWQSKAKDWYNANAMTYEEVFNSDWMELVQQDTMDTILDDLLLGAEHYGAAEEPEFAVPEGGREYWCRVTDSAGKHVDSEKVAVYDSLYIAEEPRNINWQKEAGEKEFVMLDCQAGGGSGEYRYNWYMLGEDIPYGLYQQSECMDPGTYICRVSDLVTGEEVESLPCIVYDVKPLTICTITGGNDKRWPEEEWLVAVTVEGGTPPYEGWLEIDGVWASDEDTLLQVQGEPDSQGRSTLSTVAVGGEIYTFHVIDAMGEHDFAVTKRWERHLSFSEQPQDGILKVNGSVEVACTVSDGEGPYTYVLYRNGEANQQKTTDGRFKVWYPGQYYIRVTDSKGHTGETDKVFVQNEKFRITDYSDIVRITEPGKGVRLYVEVAGGREPYSHEWLELTDKGWRSHELGIQSAFYAWKPGTYACRVTDADGKAVRTREMEVIYDAEVPMIITQPKSAWIPEDGSSVRLTCKAVSGTGNDEDLLYVWYKLTGETYLTETMIGYGLQSIKVSSPAFYYCRVTDRSNGKNVSSDYVTVMQELRVEASHDVTVIDGTRGYIWLDVQGGMAPYTVRAYATVNGNAVYCGESKITEAGKTEIRFEAYFTYVENSEGRLIRTLCPYTLRIYDNGGQEIRCFPAADRVNYGHTVKTN